MKWVRLTWERESHWANPGMSRSVWGMQTPIDRATPIPIEDRLLRPKHAAWYLNVKAELGLRGRASWTSALPSSRSAHPLHAADAR